MTRTAAAIAILLTCSFALMAGDWPQFKGASGLGSSDEKNLPTEWTKDKGIRWKAELPSRGISGPVVMGDRVYVTCSSGTRDDRLHVLCFDVSTGKQLWHRQLNATGGTACHPKTCMAAPTPAADSSGVYALFATGDLAAFDKDGNLRWYRSLVGDYPSVSNQVGMAASPVLLKDRLIVPMDNAGESFLAAIDIKNGQNLWKVDRPRDINWVTPVARQVGNTTEILVLSAKGLFAYDAATGKERWTHKQLGGTIPSPSLVGETLFLPSGGVTVVKLGVDGVAGDPVWKVTGMQSGMGSPLVYGDRVYTVSKDGVITCAATTTGRVVWKERIKGTVSASPVAADGKMYIVDENGTTTVIGTGSEAMDVVATNPLGADREERLSRAVGESGRRLHAIVTEFLELARAESGQIAKGEPVDILALCRALPGVRGSGEPWIAKIGRAHV